MLTKCTQYKDTYRSTIFSNKLFLVKINSLRIKKNQMIPQNPCVDCVSELMSYTPDMKYIRKFLRNYNFFLGFVDKRLLFDIISLSSVISHWLIIVWVYEQSISTFIDGSIISSSVGWLFMLHCDFMKDVFSSGVCSDDCCESIWLRASQVFLIDLAFLTMRNSFYTISFLTQ